MSYMHHRRCPRSPENLSKHVEADRHLYTCLCGLEELTGLVGWSKGPDANLHRMDDDETLAVQEG